MTNYDDTDMVARRIVLRREVWDQLVKIAEARAAAGFDTSASDVAVDCLLLGLPKAKKKKKTARLTDDDLRALDRKP